ncbi:MAG TPA: hypothetical protein VFT32_11980, partial [Candidatus Eisenbacteria bacterium]|nr:hypothetical protein [Candidatus Eisenbacteria bacterium]
MNLEIGSQVRYDGAVRNPDREGALAHLDLDRGFALVARASLTGIDVIDPTIWVREKLTVAMAGAGSEPPLRAALAAVRSLHGEIMKRPERDRSWIAVHLLLFHGDDGVAISAGDCPCYRYRNGVLAGLGKSQEESPSGAPRGSLGSETQVRIEVVPLRPQPGDLYLLATRPLQEGELILLARALESARRPGALLRAAVEGRGDAGRLALRILAPGEAATGPDAEGSPPDVSAGTGGAFAAAAATDALEFERNEPAAPAATAIPPETAIPPAIEAPYDASAGGAIDETYEPAAEREDAAPEAIEAAPELLTYSDLGAAEAAPPGPPAPYEAPAIPGAFADRSESTPMEEVEPLDEGIAATDPEHDAPVAEIADATAEAPIEAPAEEPAQTPAEEPAEAPAPPRRVLASVGDDRPWYEPLAIWGGGALAIIALALLVRAILPGILGSN